MSGTRRGGASCNKSAPHAVLGPDFEERLGPDLEERLYQYAKVVNTNAKFYAYRNTQQTSSSEAVYWAQLVKHASTKEGRAALGRTPLMRSDMFQRKEIAPCS
eukprot:6212938-Pleurochrysis_carterae.AAC.15